MPFCTPHCFRPLAPICVVPSSDRSKIKQNPCHLQVYENKGRTKIDCGSTSVNDANSVNSVNSGIAVLESPSFLCPLCDLRNPVRNLAITETLRAQVQAFPLPEESQEGFLCDV